MFRNTPIIDYKTIHSELLDADLLAIRHSIEKDNFPVLQQIDTELVLRFINNRSIGKINADQIVDLCLRYLKNDASNAFFNFALANIQHLEDSKKDYLLNAASSDDGNTTIISQAALELSKILFQEKKYLESQVWLTYSVMTGNEQAFTIYMNGNITDSTIWKEIILGNMNEALNKEFPSHAKENKISEYPSVFSLFTASVIAIILSQPKLREPGLKKIKNKIDNGFFNDWKSISLEKYKLANDISQASLEHAFKLFEYEDSALGSLACDAFNNNEELFKEFFQCCYSNKIISDDVYNLVIDFIKRYPFENEQSVEQTLSTHALVSRQLIINVSEQSNTVQNNYYYDIQQAEIISSVPVYCTNILPEDNLLPNSVYPQVFTQPGYEEEDDDNKISYRF